ncbi:alpha/beta fold hydrolase [Rhodococcus erythropolis]|uniref:alpha/beta fold hydrolase n=1 Tax=Rhodococcus erythropolis TaxID=1833 RepID=UPI001D1770D0|nr:alpha/beta fold hydrolase [Rhodococcus erythropolis]
MSSVFRSSMSVALAVTVVGLATGCVAEVSSSPPPQPVWCPTVAGHEVDCGVMNRELVEGRPDLGGVDVGYAIVRHSRDEEPAAGTILPNPGGPGAGMIESAAMVVEVAGSLLDDHDLLLVDPRGTGVSSPLDCGADEPTFRTGMREQQLQIVEQCGNTLGPRAAGYTSAATADDFDAVRERLGIPKLTLYGISYGTYLMPVYAQRHPEHVQSMVLTGAFPLDFDRLQRPTAQAVSLTLRRICDRSQACDGETTVEDLRTVAARMQVEPITVDAAGQSMLLTEGKLGNLIFESATTSVGADPEEMTPLGLLPSALHAAANGDDGPLREWAAAIVSGPELDSVDPFITISCNDYATLWSADATTAEREQQYRDSIAHADPTDFGAFSAQGWGAAQRDGGDICLRWPGSVNDPRPDQVQDPMPDVPVLVLSGDLDAITPDANGELAAAQFPSATFVSVPNTGHVPDLEPSGCVISIVGTFLGTGMPGPTECLATIPPIQVAPVSN